MDDARDAGIAVSSVRVVREGRAVVDGVSFSARLGAVTGLLGPNGAGKSSIVKALAGILPYEGNVQILGTIARALDSMARARLVAYVPQQSELRSSLSVAAVVGHGRYAHQIGRVRPNEGDRAAVARALATTETTALAGRLFTTLSHGERQRVLIARALATEARVLLLDEPTSALDVGHALKVYALMRRVAQEGRCVLSVLHPLEDAHDWTDDTVLMDNGRILASGTTAAVFAEGVLGTTFGVRIIPNGALGFRLPSAAP